MSEEQSIYQKVVIKFGVDKQVEKLEQELIELLLALSHMKEGREDHNVTEELADVRFVLRQIIPIFNEDGEVDRWHDIKEHRVRE